jgi:RNA polymerase sigma-70 factor (ECF subfamily)
MFSEMLDRPDCLIARARAGHADALGELCALYQNYLRAVARAGLGPKLCQRMDLSDVVQEAMVEVVRQFPQFTGDTERALACWLRRLVGRKLIDLVRYHNRVKRGAGGLPVSLHMQHVDGSNGGAGRDYDLLDSLSLSQPSPSEIVSRRELTGLLNQALTDLPAAEAEVLRLYHAEGLSFDSIGAKMGLGRKTVRALWARALKSLRRHLDGPPGGTFRYSR